MDMDLPPGVGLHDARPQGRLDRRQAFLHLTFLQERGCHLRQVAEDPDTVDVVLEPEGVISRDLYEAPDLLHRCEALEVKRGRKGSFALAPLATGAPGGLYGLAVFRVVKDAKVTLPHRRGATGPALFVRCFAGAGV